jgi:hypothetical protein
LLRICLRCHGGAWRICLGSLRWLRPIVDGGVRLKMVTMKLGRWSVVADLALSLYYVDEKRRSWGRERTGKISPVDMPQRYVPRPRVAGLIFCWKILDGYGSSLVLSMMEVLSPLLLASVFGGAGGWRWPILCLCEGFSLESF